MRDLIAAAVLGACLLASSSTLAFADPNSREAQWNKLADRLAKEPDLRKEFQVKCIATVRGDSKYLETLPIVLNMAIEKAPEVLCLRLMKAMISGRYTYSMAMKLKNGVRIPEYVKIIQGR